MIESSVELNRRYKKYYALLLNPFTAKMFTILLTGLLEDRVLHKEAWVAALLGTHLSIQVQKKIKFSRRDISFLGVKKVSFPNCLL